MHRVMKKQPRRDTTDLTDASLRRVRGGDTAPPPKKKVEVQSWSFGVRSPYDTN
jgi:hypothetical protein